MTRSAELVRPSSVDTDEDYASAHPHGVERYSPPVRHLLGVIANRHEVVDADDFMAGLWIIDAPSESDVHRLAGEASQVCNRRIEVREIL
jgi:hypothetical protein